MFHEPCSSAVRAEASGERALETVRADPLPSRPGQPGLRRARRRGCAAGSRRAGSRRRSRRVPGDGRTRCPRPASCPKAGSARARRPRWSTAIARARSATTRAEHAVAGAAQRARARPLPAWSRSTAAATRRDYDGVDVRGTRWCSAAAPVQRVHELAVLERGARAGSCRRPPAGAAGARAAATIPTLALHLVLVAGRRAARLGLRR